MCYVGSYSVVSYVYYVGEYSVLGSLCDSIGNNECVCYVQKIVHYLLP